MARASILQPALRAAPLRFRRPVSAEDLRRNRIAMISLSIHTVLTHGDPLHEKVVAARRWLTGNPPPDRPCGRTATPLRLVKP